VSVDKVAVDLSHVRVAVLPAIAGAGELTYAVPVPLRPLEPGTRVLVPLGRRRVTGIVLGSDATPPPSGVKAILDRLDEHPLLSADLLALCEFAASYYQASLAEVLETAVIGGLRAESRRFVRLATPPADGTAAVRAGSVRAIVLERLDRVRVASTQSLSRGLPSSAFYDALRSLEAEGRIVVEDRAPRPKATTKLDRIALAATAPDPAELEKLRRRAPARAALLERLHRAGAEGIRTAALGGARRALADLVEAGLARIETRETYRAVIGATRTMPAPPPDLTSAQLDAVAAVSAAIDAGRFEVSLLHGVTGSGKTEVYLHAASRALERGRSVLVLVPEIALTHDAVDRVCARFGERVALLHSGLGAGERWDEWRRLARREARIAVGVRSAVFAPLPELGLVVVDEEHDGAYKQEEGLRYHARDLAIVRARNASCPVVLGSATPSMESHRNAELGRYARLPLPERIERRPMPEIEIVDLRAEPPAGDPPIFSTRFLVALKATLEAGEQSVLFLNRRGFAHYLQCRLCGGVVGCPQCSVTLTLHRRARALRCHHCDHREPIRTTCADCGRPALVDFGVGTEQLEDALARLLPSARVARLDRDSIRGKGTLERRLRDWREGRYDVLVGTQIVAKGHDVPGVTFVGVVAADASLNLPDFRAAERTFQLLTQVAGRAGRGDRPGRVLVQTYRPEHFAIRHARQHDFFGFAAEELAHREALGYPPFRRLALVRLDAEDAARVEALARDLALEARSRLEEGGSKRASVLGPAPAPLERLRGRWRWQILVKALDPRSLHEAIQPPLRSFAARARRESVRIGVDVDPHSML
jgi:primosomal protein N' (replication factor Y) (superfamily II helicase)